jgi:hypothetical protein
MCVIGQLIEMMLFLKLNSLDNLKLIQANTDGITVFVERSKLEALNEICKEVSDDLCIPLEVNIIEHGRIFVKDVSNYILDDNGKIKAKGVYVKHFRGFDVDGANKSIVDECVVRYFLENAKPMSVIREAIEKKE